MPARSLLPQSRPSPAGAIGRRLALAAGATLLGGLPARQAEAALGRLEETTPPRPHPDLAFTDADGRAQRLADFAGKGLVVNFWATWCAPCVAEMPALDRAQAALEADGVVVLALSGDRGGRERVEAFYRERGIRRLGIWLDPGGKAQRAAGIRGLPTTLVLDRTGQERARLEGAAEWDGEALLARIRRIAGPLPAPTPQAT